MEREGEVKGEMGQGQGAALEASQWIQSWERTQEIGVMVNVKKNAGHNTIPMCSSTSTKKAGPFGGPKAISTKFHRQFFSGSVQLSAWTPWICL